MMFIGGTAAAFLGRARITNDVDATVWMPDLAAKDLLTWALAYRLQPRYPETLQIAIRDNMVLLRHEPSAVNLDVSIAKFPFELECISRCTLTKAGRQKLPIPRPDDFIVLKALANRDRDWIDILGVLDRHPDLKLAAIRQTVAEFAEAMGEPNILSEWDRMLARRNQRGK